jgi:hypothetical protein
VSGDVAQIHVPVVAAFDDVVAVASDLGRRFGIGNDVEGSGADVGLFQDVALYVGGKFDLAPEDAPGFEFFFEVPKYFEAPVEKPDDIGEIRVSFRGRESGGPDSGDEVGDLFPEISNRRNQDDPRKEGVDERLEGENSDEKVLVFGNERCVRVFRKEFRRKDRHEHERIEREKRGERQIEDVLQRIGNRFEVHVFSVGAFRSDSERLDYQSDCTIDAAPSQISPENGLAVSAKSLFPRFFSKFPLRGKRLRIFSFAVTPLTFPNFFEA